MLMNAIVACLIAVSHASLHGGSATPRAERLSTLTLCCANDNDLFQGLVQGGARPARFDSADEAIEHAEPGSGVLVLADRYPAERTPLRPELLEKVKTKRLRLFIEYPQSLPGIEFGEPRGIKWERAVVASEREDLGLPKLRILAVHDCRFLPTKAGRPDPGPGARGRV